MWALKKLREKNWRVSLPVMEFHRPPNFHCLATTPGFQNITCCPVRSWFPQVALIDHQPNFDTCTGEMSLLGASSLSRTEISPTVGEDGEDEEDEEE